MSTSVVILAYKEAENLVTLIPAIQGILDKMGEIYEILIIDSSTPQDNTKEVCSELGAVYIPQEELGYGGAFRTGIRYAKYETVQVLDGDWSHDPKVMPAIHRKFKKGYDLVIGSRYTKGGVSNDAKGSFLMSQILNITMRLVIGVHAKDISTSYRLYDAKQLKAVTLVRNNYDILQEVIMRMKLNKPDFRIGEVPIVFNKRVFGETKRQLGKFIRSYIVTVFILLKMRILRK